MAFSPGAAASYAISVRQASALPAASFRFHLAVDTFAVRLIVPLAGPIEDFHLQVTIQSPQLNRWRLRATRPAGRTMKKTAELGCF
jgi:hypothetical protein